MDVARWLARDGRRARLLDEDGDGLTHRAREATAVPASVVAPVVREAERTLTCATCRDTIPARASYREDRLREPVFGDELTSAICEECVAEGL